jgi:DNA-binding winged helix-turn-helix (wHTH) protein
MAWKPGETRDKIEFGEGFELNLRAYQLRQSGRVLKLEPTPMELLLFLVEHKGELITRDQIVEKIWGQGVFFDTDNSINGAIRKIRQALKDDPEQPRFVQTITAKDIASSRQSRNLGLRSTLKDGKEIQPATQRQRRQEAKRTFESAGCWLLLALLYLYLRWLVTSIFTARQNSLTKTQSSSPILRTPRTIRSSTTRCGKAWRYNLRSRLSSALSQTSASSRC